MSQKYNTFYTFRINIADTAQCLHRPPYSALLPNCGYVTMESNKFIKFRDCERTLSRLLNKLAFGEVVEEEKPVIIIRTNPKLLEEDEDDEDLSTPSEGWESNVVLKAFLVKAADIKNKVSPIGYSISGLITVTIET